MEYSRVHRLLRIIIQVQGNNQLNATRLAELCETSERNVYRDLEMLQAAGVPVDFNDETGGYTIRRDFFLRPVDFTIEEAMALFLLAREIGQREQVPHAAEAAHGAEKILAILPTAVQAEIQQLIPHVTVTLARMANEPTGELYSIIRNAISNRRALSVTYEWPSTKHDDDRGPHRFDPYALHFNQRAWYVIGQHHGRDEIRTLKLARFVDCKPTDKPYAIPDDFSIEKHFGKAWRMIPSGTGKSQRITLHFDPTVAETVADTHWHDSQQFDWQPDDSVILHFDVDGEEEITWWILSYGPHCKVLEPASLARRIQRLQKSAAEQYPLT